MIMDEIDLDVASTDRLGYSFAPECGPNPLQRLAAVRPATTTRVWKPLETI
jgi:hypothetical protein